MRARGREHGRHVPEDLRSRDLCLLAAQTNGYAIKYMRVAWITEAMCIEAVKFDYPVIEHVPAALLTDDVICAAFAQDGHREYGLRVLSYTFVRERLNDAIRAAAAVHGAAAVDAALAAAALTTPAREGDGPNTGCCIM